ncbi:hypothetical protein [Enterococcus sp. DIV0187]|uniref:hypothetical protein n=1 Tax=Enterococcus sp. DIV0187 TaxID=2774644 RepID=UPI003F236FEB
MKRKLGCLLKGIGITFLILFIGGLFIPDEKENVEKATPSSSNTSTSTTVEQTFAEIDVQAMKETFTETMNNDCEGLLTRWESTGSDYQIMTLTFIQDVKYLDDNQKQMLMDKIGKYFDNIRESFLAQGNHIYITFKTEDGTVIGKSTMMTPNVYKVKN